MVSEALDLGGRRLIAPAVLIFLFVVVLVLADPARYSTAATETVVEDRSADRARTSALEAESDGE